MKFPHIQYICNLMGVKNRLKNVHLPDEGHGYELPKRKALYPLLAEHFGLKMNAILDKNGEVTEKGIIVEPYEKMKVFSERNPRPDYAVLTNDGVGW